MVEKLPCAELICGCPSMEQIVGYYLLLGGGIFLLKKMLFWTSGSRSLDLQDKTFRLVTIGKCLLCVSCMLLLLYPKAKPFEITFLDVGQGDGIYISTGDGVICYIDGGSSSVKEVGKNRILPFLKSKGIRKIDYWFVTHTDTDHISGLLEVLESGFSVKYLVLAEASPKDENDRKLIQMAQKNKTEILWMKAGDKLCTKQTVFTCLYPDVMEIADKNEASLVLELEVMRGKEKAPIRALFTGDISTEVEQMLLKQKKIQKIDVYKSAHHGSKYSNSAEFLEVLSPKVAVISCSENNLYGHPAKNAIENMKHTGAEVYITKDRGQITVSFESASDDLLFISTIF